jgi:hypothetical protein
VRRREQLRAILVLFAAGEVVGYTPIPAGPLKAAAFIATVALGTWTAWITFTSMERAK